ncbi:MAG: AAA family ATPase [Deltaproteobacteria bacterium]|nr:AAA family ATPase [Deltaproteobacteria bacterium]NCP02621.1 AAA family ATPase [Deltaproteobacteria bacterium]
MTPLFLNTAPQNLFFTGKGGVGKTTTSTAAAIALADSGKKVLLVSTDPAAHVAQTLGGCSMVNLQVSRIDPVAETEAYSQDVLATAGADLDDEARALQEDLRCAGSEPAGWLINQSLAPLTIRDPLLQQRVASFAISAKSWVRSCRRF